MANQKITKPSEQRKTELEEKKQADYLKDMSESLSAIKKYVEHESKSKKNTQKKSTTSKNSDSLFEHKNALTKTDTRRDMTDMMLSAFGINPILLKGLNLDKLVTNSISKGFGFAKKSLSGSSATKEISEEEKIEPTFGTTKKQKSSASDKMSSVTEDTDEKLLKGVDGLLTKHFGKGKEEKDKEEEKKEGFSWMTALLAGGALLGLMSGVFKDIGLTDLVKKTQDLVNKGASKLMQVLLGMDEETSDKAAPWLMGAVEGGFIAYKVGHSLKSTAIGALLGIAYTGVQKTAESFKQSISDAENGKYTPPAEVAGIPIATFTGLVGGAAIGFKFGGIPGAIGGALIGFLGGSILTMFNNDEVRQKLGESTINEKGDQETLAKEKQEEERYAAILAKDPENKEAKNALKALKDKQSNRNRISGQIEQDIQKFGSEIVDEKGNLSFAKAEAAGASRQTLAFLRMMQDAGIAVTSENAQKYITNLSEEIDKKDGVGVWDTSKDATSAELISAAQKVESENGARYATKTAANKTKTRESLNNIGSNNIEKANIESAKSAAIEDRQKQERANEEAQVNRESLETLKQIKDKNMQVTTQTNVAPNNKPTNGSTD